MKKILGVYNKSVILTYVGIVLSLFGIYYMSKSLDVTMICMILAGICDLFDGKIARKCKRNEQEKAFGVQIDSLADTISFLVFPAVFLMHMSNYSATSFIISAVYVLAGIIRLAWFNITTDGSTSHFSGLPVTYAALIIPVYYAVTSIINISVSSIILNVLYICIAALFVLKIKISKPRGIWYGIFSLLALGAIAVILIF